MALIFMVTTGTVFGSEYEKGREEGYERHEGDENGFYGTVEKLPKGLIGIWTVNGKQVEVTRDTYIEEEYGKAEVGAHVEVKGKQEGNIFKAYKVEIKRAKQ
jgi:hypothetical protein